MRESIESYLGDCRARNLKASTVGSYEKTFEHLEAFCRRGGVIHVDRIDLSLLTDFRLSRFVPAKSEDETPRPIKPSTSGKELETLRAFCAFTNKRGWIQVNHAKELDPPREEGPPTQPSSATKSRRSMRELEDDNPNTRERMRARAMCLVTLYSGMRISDTIRLKRSAVDLENGKLLLRIMKTGAPLYVRLGPPAIGALRALPVEHECFFWNGQSLLYTALGDTRRTISSCSPAPE